MSRQDRSPSGRGFRTFFLRGLGIVLPTVLTIWLVIFVYRFVNDNIAGQINSGVRWLVLSATPWPAATDSDVSYVAERITTGQFDDAEIITRWAQKRDRLLDEYAGASEQQRQRLVRQALTDFVRDDLAFYSRRHQLRELWGQVRLGNWQVLDLIGLLIAVFLIYFVGRLLGGYMGRRVYERGERFLARLPVFKQVYPHVKQVTDLFFGEGDKKMNFSRVIAVQYPRKGIWSVGLVTGETMRDIQSQARADCMTVFIPSSPTPFTGYVITVLKDDTVDLPISIDEALRFCVSGGVIVPSSQAIGDADQPVLYVDADGEQASEAEPSAQISASSREK